MGSWVKERAHHIAKGQAHSEQSTKYSGCPRSPAQVKIRSMRTKGAAHQGRMRVGPNRIARLAAAAARMVGAWTAGPSRAMSVETPARADKMASMTCSVSGMEIKISGFGSMSRPGGVNHEEGIKAG